MTFTKEQLIERARENVKSLKFASTQHAFEKAFPAIEIDIRLAEIALASLEAEPVPGLFIKCTNIEPRPGEVTITQATPMPDGKYHDSCFRLFAAPPAPVSLPEPIKRNDADGWWMYKGRRVGGGCAEWYNRALDDCRAAMLQGADGNSPVIPDGWRLVPVEPTQAMIDAHIEGVQSGGMQKGYRAMLAAAPQQEVKP